MPLSHLIPIPSWERLGRGRHLLPDFAKLMALDVYRLDDDFDGDTLDAKYQSTANGANSAVAAISTGLVNGAILLDPGDANAGRCDLSLGVHMYGQNYAAVWWRAQTPSAMTAAKFEYGLTDKISGTDAGAVATKATPTFNNTDGVLLVYDTNDDTNLTLVGNKAGVAATAYDFTTVLTAATYYYFGVVLENDRARGYLLDANGRLIETQPSGQAWMASAVTQTVLLTPWAFCQNRSGARRSATIDRVLAYQWRTTSN